MTKKRLLHKVLGHSPFPFWNASRRGAAKKRVFRAAAAAAVAAILVSGSTVAPAEAAKRPTGPSSGGFTSGYASTQCSDFINPVGGPRVPTATCPRLISTVTGTHFVEDAEVRPLAGAGLSYGWAAARGGFALENVKMAANSFIRVSASLHISTAEAFGTGLSTPGSATVNATLWISGCMTSHDTRSAVIATSEQEGENRVENRDLTLIAYCQTAGEGLHTVYFDVDSVAILNEGCNRIAHVDVCGFVPGAGPLRASVEGTVGSVTIG